MQRTAATTIIFSNTFPHRIKYKKLSDLIASAPYSVLKQKGVALRLLNQSFIIFQKVNEQGFIYWDLRSDNIMYSVVARSVSIIDLDSCMPKASLVDNKGPTAQNVDLAYWGLFFKYVVHRTGWDPIEAQKPGGGRFTPSACEA